MTQGSRTADRHANRLLTALEPEDFAYLEPHLERVKLSKGTVIYQAGDTMRHAFFPDTAIVSLFTMLSDGKAVEMVMFGSEAGFGIPLVSGQALGRYVVEFPGTASRIDSDVLRRAYDDRPAIRLLVLRLLEALLAQTFQTMACNAVHGVEARCCRLILNMRDRARQDTLPLTHEHLAEVLGVQRSTISAVARNLQDAGLIDQGRGVIKVMNRPGLERDVCECYKTMRQRFDWLLPHNAR